DGHWTVIAPWGDKSHPSHLMGAVRALGLTWMKGSFADRDEASYSDTHGRPKPVGKLPAGKSAHSPEGQELAAMVRGLGRPGSGGLYPDGADVKMLEATAKTEAIFD